MVLLLILRERREGEYSGDIKGGKEVLLLRRRYYYYYYVEGTTTVLQCRDFGLVPLESKYVIASINAVDPVIAQ